MSERTFSREFDAPLGVTDCECGGYGYGAFETDDVNHAPLEIQAEDACACVDLRFTKIAPDSEGALKPDTMAATLFVLDLESGRPYAITIAKELIKSEGLRELEL